MKYFTLLFFISTFLFGQNLIPNGGFEEYKILPEKDGCFNGYIESWSNLNGNKGYPNATPDYLHKKGSNNGKVETYYYSKVEPFKGDAMMGVIVMPNRNFYEYVSANVPLKKGKRYEFSMFVTNGAPKYCSCSGKGFGVYLSSDLPKQTVAERVIVKPQWMITESFYTEKWENIKFRFTANDNFNHLTLGYFNDVNNLEMKSINEKSTDCIYFFVDEVSMIEIENDNSTALVNLNLPENIKEIESNLGKIEVEKPKSFQLNVEIKVKDQKTKQNIATEITLVDLKATKEISKFNLTSENQPFKIIIPDPNISYGIFAKTKGYIDGSEKIESQVLKDNLVLQKEIELAPIQKGATIVLKNIYFDSGKYELLKESFVELEKLKNFLLENPDVKIEISGHTDSQGADAMNLDLSKNRAYAVMNYLNKTIKSENRIIAVGLGKTKPVSTNETPEGRQMNRRVEFKIR